MNKPNTPSPIMVAAVILAAGASRRMGRPKMLLPWGQTTVLGHLLGVWARLGSNTDRSALSAGGGESGTKNEFRVLRVAVATAAGDSAIVEALDRLGISLSDRILNPAPVRGMFSSIQCAARWDGWDRGITHFAVVLGDQPQLTERTLRTLLGFASANPQQICQPDWAGRHRHPVLMPADLFFSLRTAPDSDLNAFLGRHTSRRAFCEVEDPGLGLDLDTPADYEQAFRTHFGAATLDERV